jgi:hypothetical protein
VSMIDCSARSGLHEPLSTLPAKSRKPQPLANGSRGAVWRRRMSLPREGANDRLDHVARLATERPDREFRLDHTDGSKQTDGSMTGPRPPARRQKIAARPGLIRAESP